ncbi:MAG: tRNA-dihydrouridine synthase family protein [Gammaproteobacteria bacterium]|nr:tRNA-dihydrouridine synthase family protein [Gammaproteobacteria bacterium]
MIKTLTLANKTFPVNIIQGPLAGVSCAPFRLLTWQYSQPAFSCTEMISCKTILHQPVLATRFMHKDKNEGPVCFQLSGNDPQALAEAVKIVTAAGADLIDLNCGCPVKKIRSKGAGSKLLTNTSTLYLLIKAMKANTHVPVSIKIRVDGNSKEKFNQEVAKVVQDAGADFLVVHGRHWTEDYQTPCHLSDIQFFVEALTIPVIGNGDVTSAHSLKKILATGCQGAMISRASVGRPWLIGKLIAELKQENFSLPSISEIGTIFITHLEHLTSLLGNEQAAILQARKFAKYYARDLTTRMAFRTAINSCESLKALRKITEEYFS